MIKIALILIISSSLCLGETLKNNIKKLWPDALNSLDFLKSSQILVNSSVSSTLKNQDFQMKAMLYHPKSCTIALRKISRFELYPQWISFIKSLQFEEQKQLITIHADHTLLPFPMIIHILSKRPTKPGVYDFSFPTGMYKGLKGQYHILDTAERCLFYAHSSWSGAKSKVPDFILELFTESLTKIAGNILIRKSSY